jgi:hypothetical protein
VDEVGWASIRFGEEKNKYMILVGQNEEKYNF